MNDLISPEKQAQNSQPKLSCPSCGCLVLLPAENCPECDINLRTGEKSISEKEASALKLKTTILCAVALVVILGTAVAIFEGVIVKPKLAQQSTPITTSDDLGEAVNIFHDLPDQNLGARPALIIDRTKATADKVEKKHENLGQVFEETE